MVLTKGKDKPKTKTILAIVIIAVIVGWFTFTPKEKSADYLNKKNKVQEGSGSVLIPITKPDNLTQNDDKGIVKGDINIAPTIDYKNLEKDKPLKKLMEARKKKIGIQNSLDMIVKSDESFIIGGSKVSMREILEKAFTKSGDVYQEEISPSGQIVPQTIREYGIHVVQPGDNIWNIHFNILKEYYALKEIQVASKADEPGIKGFSTGVGKLLKFSETMVIIYNLIEKQVAEDINLLEPLSKIVVYNMDTVFTLLEEINYNNVDKIQFDGKNIWIPANKI